MTVFIWPRASGCRLMQSCTAFLRSLNICPIANAMAPLNVTRSHIPYLAGFGYAAIRVDVRGTGESEGLLTDEYTRQELEDALEVIAWLAAQPWCTGAVGMMGVSWGGFNALQVASLKPLALKAIVTVCSSDDRYRDDVHYMGGALPESGN